MILFEDSAKFISSQGQEVLIDSEGYPVPKRFWGNLSIFT